MRQILKEREGERVVRRDDRVFKLSTTPADLENQFRWFRQFAGMPGVPRALSFSERDHCGVLVLEFIDGTPFHKEFSLHPSAVMALLEKVVAWLQLFHQTTVVDQRPLTTEDFFDHYVGKVMRRFDSARRLVPCLGRDEFTFNGETVRNPYAIVEKRARTILHNVLADARVGYIHGDPNFSNIIWTSNDETPYFVDPRGAFGLKRTMMGDICYDAARISYCMDGFCDIIEDHGVLGFSDESGFSVQLDVNPVFHVLAPGVIELLTRATPISEEGLVIREALLYLSAIPLHSHNTFQMHALLARGIDRLASAGLS